MTMFLSVEFFSEEEALGLRKRSARVLRVMNRHRSLILIGLVLLAMLLVAPPAWGRWIPGAETGW